MKPLPAELNFLRKSGTRLNGSYCTSCFIAKRLTESAGIERLRAIDSRDPSVRELRRNGVDLAGDERNRSARGRMISDEVERVRQPVLMSSIRELSDSPAIDR